MPEIPVQYQGKTYMMPWDGSKMPSRDEALNWVKAQTQTQDAPPPTQNSYFGALREAGGKLISGIREIAGEAGTALGVGKELPFAISTSPERVQAARNLGNTLIVQPATAIANAYNRLGELEEWPWNLSPQEIGSRVKEGYGVMGRTAGELAGVDTEAVNQAIESGQYARAAGLSTIPAMGLALGGTRLIKPRASASLTPTPKPAPLDVKIVYEGAPQITDPRRMLPSVAESRGAVETPLVDVPPVVSTPIQPIRVAPGGAATRNPQQVTVGQVRGKKVVVKERQPDGTIKNVERIVPDEASPTNLVTRPPINDVDEMVLSGALPESPRNPVPSVSRFGEAAPIIHDTTVPPSIAELPTGPTATTEGLLGQTTPIVPPGPSATGTAPLPYGLRPIQSISKIERAAIEAAQRAAVAKADAEAAARRAAGNNVPVVNRPVVNLPADRERFPLAPTRLQDPGANQRVFQALVPPDLGSRTRWRNPEARQVLPPEVKAPEPIQNYPSSPLNRVDRIGTPLSEADLRAAREVRDAIQQRLQKFSPIYNRPVMKIVGPKQVAAEIAPKPTRTLRQAFEDWDNKRKRGAIFRAAMVDQEFVDLPEGQSAIKAFQSGDRTGRLADVQKYFDAVHSVAVKAGILKEGQFKENYLRQLWKNSEDEVRQAYQRMGVKEIPNFAKESIFKSYAQGIAAGLTPKYNNIRDIIKVYEGEVHRALANKELYNYLRERGMVAEGKSVDPRTWRLNPGPDYQEAYKYLKDALEETPDWQKNIADVFSYTKNLYLGGGIPWTPLNIHGYNVTRSDIAARGAIKGLGNFFRIFQPGRAARQIKDLKANQSKIADWIDKGYEYGVEDRKVTGEHRVPLEKYLEEYKVGRAVHKGVDFFQRIVEDPLFKVHLPHTKFKFTEARIKELTKRGMDTEAATRAAIKDANAFYGGINKALRRATYNDALRIGFLAPDWFESRIRTGARQVAGTARVLAGRARETDPLYAKAFARSLAMHGAGKGATIAAGKSLYDIYTGKPTDVTDIPIGETPEGREIKFPVHGTANEHLRLPEQIAVAATQGDIFTPLDIIKNRLNQPIQSTINIVTGRDSLGRPLHGRGLTLGESVKRMGVEAARPFTYPWMSAFVQFLTGQMDPVEAGLSAIEAPVEFSSPDPKKGRR